MTACRATQPEEDPVAAVASWRARGAADADPVGFCIIEGLARRAAGLQGAVRGLLWKRIEQRLAAHADSMARLPPVIDLPKPEAAGFSVLRALVDRLDGTPASPALRRPERANGGGTSSPSSAGGLMAVTAYQRTWSRLRAEQRLRQALAQVPPMAGPLNSSQVVHRALQAMHDLSPEYLEAFLAHIDTLAWLEQASGARRRPTRS
jgi:hypothetical protein